MAENKNQEKLRQCYMEMQVLEQQIRQLQQQIHMLDSQAVEFTNTQMILDDFAKAKTGSDTLVSISPGIFAKGKITDNKELLVNVGSDVLVEKSVEEAKALLDGQIEEIKKAHGQMLDGLQEMVLKAQSIEKEMEKLSENV